MRSCRFIFSYSGHTMTFSLRDVSVPALVKNLDILVYTNFPTDTVKAHVREIHSNTVVGWRWLCTEQVNNLQMRFKLILQVFKTVDIKKTTLYPEQLYSGAYVNYIFN